MKGKQYNFNNIKGLVIGVRARKTKNMVRLYHGTQSGLSDSGYLVVCDKHGTKHVFDKIKLAERQLHHPDLWCSDCKKEYNNPKKEEKTSPPIKTNLKLELNPEVEFVLQFVKSNKGVGATQVTTAYLEANKDKIIKSKYDWAMSRLRQLENLKLVKKTDKGYITA